MAAVGTSRVEQHSRAVVERRLGGRVRVGGVGRTRVVAAAGAAVGAQVERGGGEGDSMRELPAAAGVQN